MIVFNSRESILQVVSLRLKDVAERLKTRYIVLDVDETAKGGSRGKATQGCTVRVQLRV